MFTMASRKDGPNLLPHPPARRRFERLDYHNLHPSVAQRRCNLGADEPHADQHRAATTTALRADAISIPNRAQVVDILQFGPREAHSAVAHPRGDEQPVIGYLATACQVYNVV